MAFGMQKVHGSKDNPVVNHRHVENACKAHVRNRLMVIEVLTDCTGVAPQEWGCLVDHLAAPRCVPFLLAPADRIDVRSATVDALNLHRIAVQDHDREERMANTLRRDAVDDTKAGFRLARLFESPQERNELGVTKIRCH